VTFLQIADLQQLNPANQKKDQLLENFQLVTLSGGVAESQSLTLPALREAQLPRHLQRALLSGFSLAPVVADSILNLCKKIFLARNITLDTDDLKLLQQAVHQLATRPQDRLQISLPAKTKLVNGSTMAIMQFWQRSCLAISIARPLKCWRTSICNSTNSLT
ncbi:MAG: hypothetical protein ACRYF5_18825, partial [Janthinobacterium lividum]